MNITLTEFKQLIRDDKVKTMFVLTELIKSDRHSIVSFYSSTDGSPTRYKVTWTYYKTRGRAYTRTGIYIGDRSMTDFHWYEYEQRCHKLRSSKGETLHWIEEARKNSKAIYLSQGCRKWWNRYMRVLSFCLKDNRID